VPKDKYEIYVDGSYISGATGYGAVVLKNGDVLDELSGPVDASEVSGTRQVAGELVAVKEALNWCRENSVDEVSIYFDYLGIEKWATGQWKTNQPLTREYARFVIGCPIKIRWHKVNSHTGDRWNDRADALAKKGASSRRPAGGKSGIVESTVTQSAREMPSAPEPGERRLVGGDGDLITELVKKTDSWIGFLSERGVEARLDRVYNEQFARIFLMHQGATVGIFDLYNTRKKRFSPYVHGFRDNSLKLRIEAMWTEFRSASTW